MSETSSRLAECEARPLSDMRRVHKAADGCGGGGVGSWFGRAGTPNVAAAGTAGQIYPPGSEYQLVNVEA